MSESLDVAGIEAAVAVGDSTTVLAVLEKACREHDKRHAAELMEEKQKRKQFEKELQQRNAEYRTLAEHFPDGIIRLNRGFQITFANPSGAKMIGTTWQKLLWKTPLDFPMPMHIVFLWQGGVERVFANGKEELFEYEFDDLRTVHYLKLRMIPEFDPEGRIVSVLAVTQDISEQKKTTIELREIKDKFQLALETSPLIIYAQNGNLSYTWVHSSNPKLPIDKFLGKTDRDIYPAEEANRMIALKQQVLQTGQSLHEEFETTTASGKLYLDITVAPLRNNEGQIVGVTGVALDVTERKQNEQALRESEERFRAAFENGAIPMALTNLDTKIMKVNAALCEFLGYTESELVGRSFKEITCPEDIPLNLAKLNAVFSGEESRTKMEKRYIHKDGRIIWGDMSTASVRDAQGNPIYIVTHIQDITDRKQAEETLRKSEESFRALVTASSDVLYRMSPDWREMCFLSGGGFLANTEKPNCNWLQEYIHPIDQPQVTTVIQEAIRSKSVFELEHRVIRADGSLGWTFSRAIPILDADGVIIEWFGAASDVTARKLAENALRESEERLRLFIEHAPAAIAMFDKDMRYLAVSKRWMEDYELGEHEIVGLSHYEVFPEISQRWKDIHARCLAGATERAEEDLFPRADGHMEWVRWEIHPWRKPEGEIGGIIMFTEVITERKKAEDRIREYADNLKEQTAQLKASNRELEVFSYSISHNLRAPLRSIDGFSHALLEEYSATMNDKGRKYLTRIRASAQRMGQLIEDILTLSLVIRKSMFPTEVNLSDLARNVLDRLREIEPKRQVQAIIPERITARGDMELLSMVIYHLIGNAWKFTSHKTDARIEFGEKSENGRRIYFVRDNGIGFDMRYAESLFKPFYRLHGDEEFPGTGVGLSIVRRIIDRHGGKIRAESEPGKGASFCFSLGE